jgi:hypothetical protein
MRAQFVVALALVMAQASPRAGRWVESTTGAMPLALSIDADGTVRPFIPAPQFSATYKVDAGRVVATASDGSVQAFTPQGDTLLGPGNVALKRVSTAQEPPKDNVQGTWAMDNARSGSMFMTFRSDGQVILEVAPPGSATKLNGDALTLNNKNFTVRQTNDALYLEEGTTSRRFVRRPWGCFGLASEAQVAECR